MYLPAEFAADAAQTQEILRGVEVGDLVTATDDGLLATFPPLMYAGEGGTGGTGGTLRGHLARANVQWQRPARGPALVIVHGPDGYVSPSWYPSTAQDGRTVPTWNMVLAHVYGRLVVHDDRDWVDAVVRALSDRQERDRTPSWSVGDVPIDYHEGMLHAIVGVEVVVDRVQAKVKLSQNRTAADVRGVIAGLRAESDGRASALADAMTEALRRRATG